MSDTILPSGETLKVTPEEILRYLDPDGIRQLLRQERLRWNLKPNRDADYYGKQTLFKYTGVLHNDAIQQRMEIRTFPDNGANAGFTGIHNDSGEFGILHNLDQWDHAISKEALEAIVNRTQIGSSAKIPGKSGYGFGDTKEMVKDTDNRMAAILFDPFDGRCYLYTNDDIVYVNNDKRSPETRLPLRTIARLADIPTRLTDLDNDLDFIADPDYKHTDNNFTNSNRFVVDNIDDRTFVFPEIAKDTRGQYIENFRIGLNGERSYGESDGAYRYNSQPDLGNDPDLGDHGDRLGEAINAYGKNQRFSGLNPVEGYLPGIFRSYEELERVDLVDQLRTLPNHQLTPGAKRQQMFYSFDGIWSPTWFDRFQYNDSYLAQSMHPSDMTILLDGREPHPHALVDHTKESESVKIYQWRYNRISTKYHAKDISIRIIESGQEYHAGDLLRWTFTDEVIFYRVTKVGANGQIQAGEYVDTETGRIFEQDPSTHGVGIPFTNTSSVGRGAKLAVTCPVTITTRATQIKNNLYAYVDIVPTVRSDNTSPWSDIMPPSTQGGLVNVRSTAASPGYTGVNSGRGGPPPSDKSEGTRFHEHGGNATAGVHVHLFRYVINTQNPTWVVRDGIQVFIGRWVDQGPLGVERPCDIKALLLSNPDTNNFNNYYKFMLDTLFDSMNRVPDAVSTKNPNAVSPLYLHVAECDPLPDQRFTEERANPDDSKITTIDITDKVLYFNAATGLAFIYNTTHKNDPSFGYGNRPIGWTCISGAIAR